MRPRLAVALAAFAALVPPPATADAVAAAPVYTVSPVGWVRNAEGRSYIEIDAIDAYPDTPVLDLKP